VFDLGVVGALLIFGLTRRAGVFAGGLPTFTLVSGFQLAQHNRDIKCHFFSAAFPSQLEAMVGVALTRASALRVGLGVGGALIASGSRTRPSHSCGFQLAQHNRDVKCHFFIAAFPSQLEAMVGGALARASALNVGLGVGGTTIASGSRVRTSHSWTSRLLTSSFSLGVSSLFCRATQCM
jgi:hypothetical protein